MWAGPHNEDEGIVTVAQTQGLLLIKVCLDAHTECWRSVLDIQTFGCVSLAINPSDQSYVIHVGGSDSGTSNVDVPLSDVKDYIIKTSVWHEITSTHGKELALYLSAGDSQKKFTTILTTTLRTLGKYDRLTPPRDLINDQELDKSRLCSQQQAQRIVMVSTLPLPNEGQQQQSPLQQRQHRQQSPHQQRQQSPHQHQQSPHQQRQYRQQSPHQQRQQSPLQQRQYRQQSPHQHRQQSPQQHSEQFHPEQATRVKGNTLPTCSDINQRNPRGIRFRSESDAESLLQSRATGRGNNGAALGCDSSDEEYVDVEHYQILRCPERSTVGSRPRLADFQPIVPPRTPKKHQPTPQRSDLSTMPGLPTNHKFTGAVCSWRCGRCNVSNAATSFRCENCAAVRSDVWQCPDLHKCERRLNPLNQKVCPDCKSWKCQHCTIINYRSSAVCIICNSKH